MVRRQRLWLIASIVFTLVNLVGEVLAAMRWEWVHAAVHGLLLLVGMYGVWRFLPSRAASY